MTGRLTIVLHVAASALVEPDPVSVRVGDGAGSGHPLLVSWGDGFGRAGSQRPMMCGVEVGDEETNGAAAWSVEVGLVKKEQQEEPRLAIVAELIARHVLVFGVPDNLLDEICTGVTAAGMLGMETPSLTKVEHWAIWRSRR